MPPPPASSAEEAADSGDDESCKKDVTAIGKAKSPPSTSTAAASRESFLRRLELKHIQQQKQQQQKQQKELKFFAEEVGNTKAVIEVSGSAAKPHGIEKKEVRPPKDNVRGDDERWGPDPPLEGGGERNLKSPPERGTGKEKAASKAAGSAAKEPLVWDDWDDDLDSQLKNVIRESNGQWQINSSEKRDVTRDGAERSGRDGATAITKLSLSVEKGEEPPLLQWGAVASEAELEVGKENPPENEASGDDKKMPPPWDQALLDYLSKYCQLAGGNVAPPSNWIRDVDPSSLEYLKGLAGIKGSWNANEIPGLQRDTTPSFSARLYFDSQSSGFVHATSAAGGRSKQDAAAPSPDSSRPNLGESGSYSDGYPVVPGVFTGGFHGVYPSGYGYYGSSSTPPSASVPAVSVPKEEALKTWEVNVPQGAVPGESFAISANGVKVRVVCPKNANAGQRIRFNLPDSLFVQPPPYQPPPEPWRQSQQPQLMGHWPYSFSQGNYGRSSSKGDEKPLRPPRSSSSASSDEDLDRNISLQHRMLDMIERQEVQMNEMQARLDAVGRMVARMEDDVGYLRWQAQQQGQQRGYRILGSFFGSSARACQPPQQEQRMPLFNLRGSELPPSSVTSPPCALPFDQQVGGLRPRQTQQQQPQQQRQQQQHQQQPANGQGAGVVQLQPRQQEVLQQSPQQSPPPPREPQAPHLVEARPEFDPPRAIARPFVHGNRAAPLDQGIFFPLFVMLFRFLVSFPRRAQMLLLSTGVGRVFVHLRQRAIDRNAFANIDLSSIMKLLVMLLIFAGRTGRDGGGGGNRRNRINGQQQEEAGAGRMMAHVYAALRAMIDYWNGHRVHTLVFASLVAFLIQVGLMGFLYDVLWVEREELLMAWMGHDEANDDEGDMMGGDGDGQAAVEDSGVGQQGDRGNVVQNDAAVPNGPNAPPVGHPASAGVAGGGRRDGLIRRGPNNGGFLHDVQCLILSFLLSLIPAWRPEEAAGQELAGADQQPELPQEQEGQIGADDVGQQQHGIQLEGGEEDRNVAE